MPTFTATLELDDEQTAAVIKTAAFYEMELRIFLNNAFQSGIAHAQQLVLPDDEGAYEVRDSPKSRYDLDDDIPF